MARREQGGQQAGTAAVGPVQGMNDSNKGKVLGRDVGGLEKKGGLL